MTRVNERKLESKFQGEVLIPELRELFPGCVILKNDSGYIQGIPDLTIFYKNKYAVLEVKAHAKAERQPNQEYYIDLFSSWTFAAFIFPENKDDVLYALQQSFATARNARISKRQSVSLD